MSALAVVPAAPAVMADSSATATATATATVASLPDAPAATTAARQQGSPVEVLDDRTDASQTFANPDGTFSYQTFAEPKWVMRKGSWQELDASLRQTPDGDWALGTRNHLWCSRAGAAVPWRR